MGRKDLARARRELASLLSEEGLAPLVVNVQGTLDDTEEVGHVATIAWLLGKLLDGSRRRG